MRLIDTDRMIKSIEKQMQIARSLIPDNKEYQNFVDIAGDSYLQEVTNAPTVEAIPIEWLEKCKDRYILCCTIIDDIIEEWRQNERR